MLDVEDEVPEWMRMLGGGAPDSLLSTDGDAKGIAALEQFSEPPAIVADQDDAAALLAAVKARLRAESGGDGTRYYDFLQAISEEPVDYEGAEAIVAAYDDLANAFRKCYGKARSNISANAKPKGARAAAVAAPATPPVATPQEAAGEGAEGQVEARLAQLVHLIVGPGAGLESHRARAAAYARRRALQPALPRRLFILRGPPGSGKTSWAERSLFEEVPEASNDDRVAKLVHVCSAEGFFEHFEDGAFEIGEGKYVFDRRALRANQVLNETKVCLAMAVGIEPLYVEDVHLHVWDMQAYVLLADRLGYVVTLVGPEEVDRLSWSDTAQLSRRCASSRKHATRPMSQQALETMLLDFEDLAGDIDPLAAIRAAMRPDEASEEAGALRPFLEGGVQTLLPPSALLCKLQQLLQEGEGLLRYAPPGGKGWGVSGQLCGDWHSFRERSDGSCTYDDGSGLEWATEDPDKAWSLNDLTMLEDLRRDSAGLPEAAVPTAASHPSLFGRLKPGSAQPAQPSAQPAQSAKRRRLAASAAPAVPAPATPEPEEEEEAPAASRKERFKQRMIMKVKVEEEVAKERPTKVAKTGADAPGAPEVVPRPGVPTYAEESMASTFLAAVKSRLTEWGKPEQYHEFVCALAGTVDARSAVRILRGHDDLLQVFKSQFAPRADLGKIKAELKEEEEGANARGTTKGLAEAVITAQAAWGQKAGDRPQAPSEPPPDRRVKVETGAQRQGLVKQELGGPAPPRQPPPRQGNMVKEERLGPAKGEADDGPRPPASEPSGRRSLVKAEEDSDVEMPSEAAVSASIRKGREACIGELAKVVFRKERAAHTGARERLTLVRYASARAARPRFPRELFILRGPPGVGKTEYAQQRLAEAVEVEPGEEDAARLTHVCAADDFFERYGDSGPTYKFQIQKLEAYHHRNELRVRLAMEAGIHPLFVDCTNLRLWEMRPHVLLADRLGYVVTIVEPNEVSEQWDNVDFLVSANATTQRSSVGKVVPRGAITPLVEAFEALPKEGDALQAVRDARRPAGKSASRVVDALPSPPPSDELPPRAPAPWERRPGAAAGAGVGGASGAVGEAGSRWVKKVETSPWN